jgi:hypothetical protein
MDVDSQGTTVDGNCQMTGYERTGSLMKRLRLRIYGKDPSSVFPSHRSWIYGNKMGFYN